MADADQSSAIPPKSESNQERLDIMEDMTKEKAKEYLDDTVKDHALQIVMVVSRITKNSMTHHFRVLVHIENEEYMRNVTELIAKACNYRYNEKTRGLSLYGGKYDKAEHIATRVGRVLGRKIPYFVY